MAPAPPSVDVGVPYQESQTTPILDNTTTMYHEAPPCVPNTMFPSHTMFFQNEIQPSPDFSSQALPMGNSIESLSNNPYQNLMYANTWQTSSGLPFNPAMGHNVLYPYSIPTSPSMSYEPTPNIPYNGDTYEETITGASNELNSYNSYQFM